MRKASARLARLKEKSLGFTLIEIMIVIAVIGMLSIVTVPKYQGLIDHYHLESSAQIVAGQLRNAKQYAMDRRTNIYVMFNLTSVQIFYVDEVSHEFVSLEDQKKFDLGIFFESGESQGVMALSDVIDDFEYEPSIIPPYDQCLIFDRKGFLNDYPVKIALANTRTPQGDVYVNLTSDSLEVKITW